MDFHLRIKNRLQNANIPVILIEKQQLFPRKFVKTCDEYVHNWLGSVSRIPLISMN